jgi:hypothetical protein
MSNGGHCCIAEVCCPPPAAPPYSAGEDAWRDYGLRLREWYKKRIAALAKMLTEEAGLDAEPAREAAEFLIEGGFIRTVEPHLIADVQAALTTGTLKLRSGRVG